TGAVNTDNDGRRIQGLDGDATPFEMGAGEVRPAKSFDPGLVYDSNTVQWLQYSCGIGVDLAFSDGSTSCGLFGSINPSDLNYPSIAVGALAGSQTVKRTVTNVTKVSSEYTIDVTAPAGYKVSVTPKKLFLQPGASKTYSMTITRGKAALDE